jgi:hypothetical protein
MPSADFTAWLAETATDRVILCDLQLAEQTAGDGWASEGSNVYSLSSFSNFIGSGGDAVYRRIDKVRENAADYTEKASQAEVAAASSSFWYDEANTKLYVRTSTDSDPDLFSSIAVYFTLFFGTTTKAFVGGQLYEPMLVGELPAIDLQAEDILFGVKVMEEGNLDLQNAHAFWDTAVANYIWKNKLITFYLGGGTLDFDDYEKIATMRIEDLAAGDDIARARLVGMASVLDQNLPLSTVSDTGNPNAADGVVGTYIPMIYGALPGCPGKCIDTTSGANVWLLNDPDAFALTGIANVRMVDINGVKHGLTVTSHYTVDLAACTVTVTDTTYDQQNYSLIADCAGKTDGAGGHFNRWSAVGKDFMVLLGEESGNIGATFGGDADTDGYQEIGLYIDEPKKASEWLMELERSVRGYTYIDETGKWYAGVFLPYEMKGETADSLTDADIVTWEPEDKLESVYYKVIVKYGRNPYTREWKEVSAEDSQVRYEIEHSKTIRIETALRNKSQAARQAQRWLMTLKQPSIRVQLQARGLDGLLKQPFDRYIVTRSRAPDSSGSWTDEPCELIVLTKTLAPAGVLLKIRKIGLGDRGERIRYWATSGIGDHDSEDPADQEAYAFWHDSNGQLGAGNIDNHSSWY